MPVDSSGTTALAVTGLGMEKVFIYGEKQRRIYRINSREQLTTGGHAPIWMWPTFPHPKNQPVIKCCT
jgi:hypothetical protein